MFPTLFQLPLTHLHLELGGFGTVLGLLGALLAMGAATFRLWRLTLAGLLWALAGLWLARSFGQVDWTLGGVELRTEALLQALALLSLAYGLRRASRGRLAFGRLLGPASEALAVGLLAARLSAVAADPVLLHAPRLWLQVADGGFLGLPGLVVGLGWAHFRFPRDEVKRAELWDALVGPLLVSAGLMRLGCYAEGCDYGRRLSPGAPGWLQIMGTFPRRINTQGLISGAPAWLEQQRHAGLASSAGHAYPVHPTQLYELGWLLAVWGLSRLPALRGLRLGMRAALGAMGYLAGRSLVELLRGDPGRGLLSRGLPAALMLGVGGLLVLVWLEFAWSQPLASSGERPLALGLRGGSLGLLLAFPLLLRALGGWRQVELSLTPVLAFLTALLLLWAVEPSRRPPATRLSRNRPMRPRTAR